MASPGAMAEFQRLPVQRKVLVFVVIGGVLGLGYWKLVYTALDERLAEVRTEHASKLATQKRLADDLPKYEGLRARMVKLRELIEQNQAALPKEAEVPAFFETLQHKVAESGVEIRKWTNRGEEPVESFVKVPVEVELTGTFMQIKRFFASLIPHDVRPAQPPAAGRPNEPRERIVSIENLALTSPTVKDRDLILTAKFTAVTFRQDDRSATPDKAAAGQPTAGAARPASSSPAPSPPAPPAPVSSPSSPPLPSAATPAGVKARLDEAVDKSDARTRNAIDGASQPAAGSDRLRGGL